MLRTAQVLIVDDDEPILVAIREALIAEGHNATCVDTLEWARKALQAEYFDVVLLDVMLRGETGEDLLTELTQNPNAPPVILISALPAAKEIAARHRAAFLAKPFDVGALLATIRKVVHDSDPPTLF